MEEMTSGNNVLILKDLFLWMKSRCVTIQTRNPLNIVFALFFTALFTKTRFSLPSIIITVTSNHP